MSDLIYEKIQFGQFDSANFELFLIERDAPTPNEKEVLLSIPYAQGTHDFSALLGERVFENRTNRYVLRVYNKSYDERKIIENKVKDLLLSQNYNQLIDTHDPDGFWWGKCSKVTPDDDNEYNKLTLTVEFECYPYFMSKFNYFTDLWDDFNFDYDVACYSAYDVKEYQSIIFINNGSTALSPIIHTSDEMQLKIANQTYKLKPGINQNFFIKINKGENRVSLTGTGRVVVFMRTELMR